MHTPTFSLKQLRGYFSEGQTRSYAWRKTQLLGVKQWLEDHEQACFDALKADLGKAQQESYASEIAMVKAEINHTLKHLKRWMRPRKVSTPIAVQPAVSRIIPEPLGVVLIFGAWNYPLQLCLSPMIAALAAGNCVVLKPSELAQQSSTLLAQSLPTYLDSQACVIVEGGVDVATGLLEQRFDHIFYTGGAAVGKTVMTAAARHLTPVTLELGGKSPCIVDQGVDVELAARRIAWGKFMNAGQTCVAPDYLLCEEAMVAPLVEALARAIKAMFGADPKNSPDYGRIINERHHQRLSAYLDGGDIKLGGECDPGQNYIAPTILNPVDSDSPLMTEEIFGPLLPIVTVPSIASAIEYVNAREKPLALYLFSQSSDCQREVTEKTSAGSVCINDTIMFMAVNDLPFGGVGQSGMGSYHGEQGFKTFSHEKSVLTRANFFDLPLRYAPFSKAKLSLLRLVLR